ncbi:MAG: hypothetical protein H7A36_06040 [Chlamydiales bacterium]|nr:hypothetical protein [Chlamydiales bacterium]
MRSRFSAYALCKADYILETAKEKSTRSDIEEFSKSTKFEKLTILSIEPSHVTFRAQLSQNGHDCSFTEKSHFEKVNGRWIYISGKIFH